MNEELLTADQLAVRLGVQAVTIRNWTRSGRIPCIRFSPKVIRYDLSEVMSAVETLRDREGGTADA